MSTSILIPDLTGHVIEPYKLVECIGSGAHGAVYRAIDMAAPSSSSRRDPRTDRAIKVIPKDGPILGALEIGLHSLVSDHPHVVTMEDAFEDEHFYFLVLDLCPGGDLSTKINEGIYHHNDALVRSTFLQIVDAVQACHAASVYHRDLKPENILCNEDGSEVYLCDFGMGRGRPINREFGSGNLNYMSPECLGEDIGRIPYSNVHHDIWALGILLVNMITASCPWTSASTGDEEFSDYLHNPKFFLDKFDISEGANDILRKVLVLNPMGRMNLPELRTAVLGLESFFCPTHTPQPQVKVPEDVDKIAFCLVVTDEDGEELATQQEELYIFPTPDRFCAPLKPFEQPLELDYRAIDAIVRSFLDDSDVDQPEPSICSRTSSTSSTGSDDSDVSDCDSDGPITPGIFTPDYGLAAPDINVYEGEFAKELGGLVHALPMRWEPVTKPTPSPTTMDKLFPVLPVGEENEQASDIA